MAQYSSFATGDVEVARNFVSQSLEVNLNPFDEAAPFRLRSTSLDAGPFYIGDLEITAGSSFSFVPDHEFFVTRVSRGRLRALQAGVDESMVSGEICLVGRPGVETRTEIEGFREDIVAVQAKAVREAAGLDPDGDELPTFRSIRPHSARRAASWRRAVDQLGSMLTGDLPIAEAPLVIGSAGRLLAGLLIATFPNDAITAPEGRDATDSRSPAALRRAVAFIDGSADLDIGIAEIAEAARVSRRAVQLTFRRHLDTTPTAYLRRVRLDHAHRELLAASPDDGLTVTDVAYRWGFSSPSRFTERYRAVFGLPPSATLRR